MVRPRSKSRDELTVNAMQVFWRQGFAATSMNDLVRATGVSRGSVYGEFSGKDELFMACLGAYRQKYIEPALAVLEDDDNGLAAIEGYFDFFIELHRRHGLPGPGCFFANAMTELAPHKIQVRKVVNQHTDDLQMAFIEALSKSVPKGDGSQNKRHLKELANFLAIASQGLWSQGRSMTTLKELESFKSVLLGLLRARLASPEVLSD